MIVWFVCTARSGLPWTQDDDATAYIQELPLAPIEVIPFTCVKLDVDGSKFTTQEDILVYKLKSMLQSDERRTSPVLVVPPGTRGAWLALRTAIKPGQTDQNFLMVGSPGIGKSRTINYFIREVILERRQDLTRSMPVIVFEHRKDGCVWLFSPKNASDHMSEYEAFSMSTLDFDASKVAALKNPDNVYVVDSGKAQESKDPVFVRAVCVYVCSPDTRHFSEWSKHLQRGDRFNIPMWHMEALEAACLHLGVTLETVQERAPVVGPIPRRVCNTAEYKRFKVKIDMAMSSKQDEIAGVLLDGAGGVETDHHRDKPLSSVFAFYERPGSNFKEVVVGFVSDYARQKLGLAAFKSVYNSILSSTDPFRNAEYGYIFEALVFRFVEYYGGLTCMDMMGQAHPEKVQKGGKMVNPGSGGKMVKHGRGGKMVKHGIDVHQRMYDVMKKMPMLEMRSSKSVFVGGNFPAIDFADARNRGFSITISRDKQISSDAVAKLRVKVGLAKDIVLHLVFVVPEGLTPPKVSSNTVGVKWYTCFVPSPLTQADKWKEVLAPATTPAPAPIPASSNSSARGFSTLTCFSRLPSVRVFAAPRSAPRSARVFVSGFMSPARLGQLAVRTIKRIY